jgi:glycosyltransferase involved in cell wall biosynthesis
MSIASPTLAVVISNFNYASFLPDALESVLNQTRKFDEIIVVNDGSTDNSLEVLRRYADLVKIISVANGGQLGACRTGVAATSSEYIYFLDADDYAENCLVERVRSLLIEKPAKVQFQLRGVDKVGRSLGSIFPSYPLGYNAALMRQDNNVTGLYICPPTSGNIFSRKALDQLNLSTLNSRGSIDESPALAMPYIGEVTSLNEPLANYRVHGKNFTGDWSKLTVELLQNPIELLQSEINRHYRNWDEVRAAAVNVDNLPPASHYTNYIVERRLMIACLENRIFVGDLFWKFVVNISKSHLPSRNKIILVLWATAMLIPSAALRRYCVRIKRSSANRTGYLQSILNSILTPRRKAHQLPRL